jgi:hypothetical protein
MAGDKPGPAPTGKKVKKVSVALRPSDIEWLRRIAAEQFVAAQAPGLDGFARLLFEHAERPSVSGAIRYLIDSERTRRAAIAETAWRYITKAEEPDSAHMMEFDFVFGNRREPQAAVDVAFVREYRKRLTQQQQEFLILAEFIKGGSFKRLGGYPAQPKAKRR